MYYMIYVTWIDCIDLFFVEAIVIGILYIAPLSVLHLWDYYKLSLDVQGRTKMFIQTTLFRKYLNYSATRHLRRKVLRGSCNDIFIYYLVVYCV